VGLRSSRTIDGLPGEDDFISMALYVDPMKGSVNMKGYLTIVSGIMLILSIGFIVFAPISSHMLS
jgi:hypothetical protein